MIVDDSKMLQQLLTQAILKIDPTIELIQSENCSDAMNKFRPFHPDKIILDISLPDGSGINLITEFRSIYADVSILMLTNYSSREIRKKCLDAGAHKFFDKAAISDLLQYLNTHLA